MDYIKLAIFVFIFTLSIGDLWACAKGAEKLHQILEREMNASESLVQVEVKASASSMIRDSKTTALSDVDSVQAIGQQGKTATDLGSDGIVLSGGDVKAKDIFDPAKAAGIERETAGAARLVDQDVKTADVLDAQVYRIADKKDRAALLAGEMSSEELTELQKASKIILGSADERAKIRSLPEVEAFKNAYAKSTLEFDNRNFIAKIDDIPAGKKPVYFDVENSVLKQLNDEIFETKDLGDAAGNLFNRILFDKIQSTPELAQKLSGRYRDFKSLRFQFLLDEGEDSGKVLELLKKIYGESAAEFEKQLRATGMAPLWAARTGQTGKPEKWFLAGAGDSPLEANMAARQARGMLDEMGSSNRMVLYSDRVENLSSDIKSIESIREALSEIPSLKQAKIMVDSGDGQMILSKDAIGVLRKTKRGDFKNLAEYRESVNKQFNNLFGTKVDDLSIDGMTKYFEGVDSLSPPLFVRSRTGIDLSQADNGLVSVDFTGVGVDNAYEAMIGLAKTSGEAAPTASYVNNALKSVDGHVDNVTDSMNRAKVSFNNGTKQVSPEGRSAVFSGDDGMYFPDSVWKRKDKQQLVNELSKSDPAKYRVTFVETTYKEGKIIPAHLRSEYIVKAEKVEKAIRKSVTGLGNGQISPERAKEIMIAIDYSPSLAGKGKWNLIFGGKLTAQEKRLLQKALRQAVKSN